MRSNQKNSGFLPEERGWLDRVIDELGYVDVFRELEPRPEQYTWWPNRGRAWEKNVGWRLDSELATLGIAARARGASVDLSMTQPRSEVTSRRSPVNAPSVVVTRRQSSAGRKLTELPEARPAMSPGIERRRVDPAHPRRTSLR